MADRACRRCAARRIVTVFSAESPRCGRKIPSDPKPDRDAITHATEVVSEVNAVAGPVVPAPQFL